MADIHDFDDTVVAALTDERTANTVVDRLAKAGYEWELLHGEEGKDHLDPAGDTGPGATVKRLIDAFGDQYRVVERLTDELDEGKFVVSVDAKPEEADDAVRILQDHGGEFIWKLGTWTFTRVGD